MEGPNTHTDDSLKISRSKKLRLFTRMLREPVTVSGSAYRSGAHPVIATRVAAEVARSPKVGLVQTLMAEGRTAFEDKDFPRAIVKSLAAEELLRKYGGILAPNEESDIREQLQFLKIQYFLLSGQAGEAYRVLRDLRYRSHPYLWHRRMAHRSGVSAEHWLAVEHTLRQFFKTNRSGIIFCLLGYVVAMGPEPWRALTLSSQLEFEPSPTDSLYLSVVKDYEFIVTRVTNRERQMFPQNVADKLSLTPLFQMGKTFYMGFAREMSESELMLVESKLDMEVVPIPMSSLPLRERNTRLYAS